MVQPPFSKEDAEKEILAYLKRLQFYVIGLNLPKVYKKIKTIIDKITNVVT